MKFYCTIDDFLQLILLKFSFCCLHKEQNIKIKYFNIVVYITNWPVNPKNPNQFQAGTQLYQNKKQIIYTLIRKTKTQHLITQYHCNAE